MAQALSRECFAKETTVKVKSTLMAGLTMFAITASTSIFAQPYPGPPPQPDPNGYYSQYDRNGYYDRDGRYQRTSPNYPNYPDNYDNAPPPPPGPPPGYADVPAPPPPPGAYYEPGRYENNCHRGNPAAGTIFGALAGGLLGSAASRGNGGAVVGGAVLGGVLGNTISREIDCDDQPYAFQVYAEGLNGDVGRRYEWRHGDAYGYFTPTREFRRGGAVCRNFTETSYRGRNTREHDGTACRSRDGHWHFD
jgi:surface antigen